MTYFLLWLYCRGMQVAGITEVIADSAGQVMNLLQKGNLNRTTEPTAANKVSSRSHAVLQILVESKGKTSGTSHTVQMGKLSMIDLVNKYIQLLYYIPKNT